MWSDFSGISNCILSISSCWGTGTGYEPSKQARQNSAEVPRPMARMRPGIDRYSSESAPMCRRTSSTVLPNAISSLVEPMSTPMKHGKRIVELAVHEDGVGPGEVDELEHAHRVLVGGLEGDGVHPVLVHHHHLARLHLADEGGVDRVERAGLAGDHVRRLAGERDEADAERSKPERIAQRDELPRRDDP